MIEDIRKYALDNKIPIMRDATVEELIKSINEYKPRKILEIGTAIGYSGSIMLSNSKDAKLTTIELNYERAEIARKNFRDLGLYKRVNLMVGDAVEVLRCIEEKYDFVLLDGPKAHYYEMLPRIMDLLTVSGVIFADNVLFQGLVEKKGLINRKNRTIVNNMRKFIESVNNNTCLLSHLLRIDDGIMIARKI